MKLRKGFISIFALIIMSVSMIMIGYIQYIIHLESLILIANKENIQSSYDAEGKLLLSIYDEKYFNDQLIPNLYDVFRKRNFSTKLKKVTLDKCDLDENDTYYPVMMSFFDKLNRKKMMLNTYCRINGKKTVATAEVSLINRLFEIEKPVLNLNNIEDEYYLDLVELIDTIEGGISLEASNKDSNVYGFETDSFSDFLLDTYKNSRSIECSRGNMSVPYKETVDKVRVFILARKYGQELVNFYISSSNKCGENDLRGIIYVEGDMNILTDFHFDGIVIINEGELNISSDVDVSISGMLIFLKENNLFDIEDINILYNRDNLYEYGTYIPGFIDIDIDIIKIN